MSIKKQFISSTFYIALTKYIGIVIQLVITGILSRILTPDDYGLVAITSVFVIFFGLFAEMGIGPAIIQRRDLETKDLQSIFTFTCCIGVVLGLLFFAISPLISSFYERSELLNMCRVLSVGIFISCLNILPNALLTRDKMFKFLMYRQLIIQVLSGIIGIAAALSGWGVYALLVHSIVGGLLTLVINLIRKPLALGRIHIEPLRKIAGFSFYQFLFNFINYFTRNLDSLLIGKFFSPVMLGYYEKSYRLMLLPVQSLTHVLSPAIQPYFSDYQHDKQRIFTMYLKIVKVLALVGFPLSIFLYFAAPEIILIIFGPQWEASIPVFKILAWSVGLQVVLSSSGSVFQSVNDTKRMFFAGLISATVSIFAICIGIFVLKSIEGVATAMCLAFLMNFISGYFILIKVSLRSSMVAFLKVLYYPMLIALGVFILEYLLCQFVEVENIYLSLLLKMLVASLLYLPVVYFSQKKNITGEKPYENLICW